MDPVNVAGIIVFTVSVVCVAVFTYAFITTYHHNYRYNSKADRIRSQRWKVEREIKEIRKAKRGDDARSIAREEKRLKKAEEKLRRIQEKKAISP